MSVTIEQVRYTAALARLKFSDEELVRLSEDLNQILKYVEKMNEVDTSNVEPLSYPVEINKPLREDIVKPGVSREEALKNAPDHDERFFRVPKVINQS